MGTRNEPIAKVVNGHESRVNNPDIDAAHCDDAPTDSRASTLDGDAIVAPAIFEVAEPLLDARASPVDTASGRPQRPNLDVLADERLKLLKATPVESVNRSQDNV